MSILLAIVVHKGIEPFVVASAYLRSALDRKLVTALMVFFAVMSPLGAGLGILVSKTESVKVRVAVRCNVQTVVCASCVTSISRTLFWLRFSRSARQYGRRDVPLRRLA